MAKITETLRKLSGEFLPDGEELIIGLRVNLKGTALGIGLTVGIGGVLGMAAGAKLMKDGVEQVKDIGISFTQQMALGLTAERIIIWSRSVVSGKPDNMIGMIPLQDVTGVLFKKGFLGDKITLLFTGEKQLELESIKVDKGVNFARELERVIMGTK